MKFGYFTQCIANFFNSTSKKRNLSDHSDDGEKLKKPREGHLNYSNTWTSKDAFAESLSSRELVNILFNCIQNVEKQMKEWMEMVKTQVSQVKDSVDFISKKFQE